MRRLGLLLAAAITAAAPADARGTAARERDLLVFAAASLQTALDELVPAMSRAAATRVRISHAASSTLARQIEQGAPAALMISADLEWMDYLAARGLIRTDSRVNLLGNTLVLIAPAGEAVQLRLGPGAPLAAQLGNGRLAVADPASVPAGRYARAALTTLGLCESVADRLAPAANVRAALAFVSRGEAPLGIVYRTDAIADPAVVVVDTFPSSAHPPIVYPAALTAGAPPAADRVLAFLRGDEASAVFAKLGFAVLR
jgi:molybdate transport system substrate-binding protein